MSSTCPVRLRVPLRTHGLLHNEEAPLANQGVLVSQASLEQGPELGAPGPGCVWGTADRLEGQDAKELNEGREAGLAPRPGVRQEPPGDRVQSSTMVIRDWSAQPAIEKEI